MLELPQVEQAHTAVRTHAREHIDAPHREREVVHLLIVRDELLFQLLRVHVPHRARGVDGGRAHEAGILLVPIEGRERRAELRVLVVVQQTLQLRGALVIQLPQAQEVARGADEVGVRAVGVGDPVDFRGGVGVVERALERQRFRVVLQHLDLVRVLLHEAAYRQPRPLVAPPAPRQSVQRPLGSVLQNLRRRRVRHASRTRVVRTAPRAARQESVKRNRGPAGNTAFPFPPDRLITPMVQLDNLRPSPVGHSQTCA